MSVRFFPNSGTLWGSNLFSAPDQWSPPGGVSLANSRLKCAGALARGQRLGSRGAPRRGMRPSRRGGRRAARASPGRTPTGERSRTTPIARRTRRTRRTRRAVGHLGAAAVLRGAQGHCVRDYSGNVIIRSHPNARGPLMTLKNELNRFERIFTFFIVFKVIACFE